MARTEPESAPAGLSAPVPAKAPTPWAHAALLPWALPFAGLLAMYVPSFFDMAHGVWRNDDQSHGPIVLGLSLWLLYRAWPSAMAAAGDRPRPAIAWPLLLIAGLVYALGRSQGILIFEVGSLILMLIGLVLLLRGAQTLRALWFGLFFMFFMVPLPGPLVDALTQPMKLAVSYAAENLLYRAGYPISRSGVVLQIGQYQLLVADACAGLHTLFTLEALGLLYLNLVRHASLLRNVALAILIVPIGFCANVIRVITLTLVTYHFGDAAGQGFLHGFAGLVLFLVALMLIIGADSLLRVGLRGRATVQ